MLVAEIKDCCAKARALSKVGKPEEALKILNQVIANADDPSSQSHPMKSHPMLGVAFVLKAELLQSLQEDVKTQADCIDNALSISKDLLLDDFENIAPILLNICRFHVIAKQQENARVAADLLIEGCNHYYGVNHPRLFQLRRWIEEAGCV